MSARRSIDARTLASIKLNAYRCGCEMRLDRRADRRWHLCQYHDGYDDALDEHAPPSADT